MHDKLRITEDQCLERAELNPLRAFDCMNDHCLEFMAESPLMGDNLCDECREHYEQVKRYLDAAGIEYVEDPTLVRGLDYYTRTVFEVEAPGAGVGSIGGGGRYDGMVELEGGKPTAGVGFAVGFERALLALQAFGSDLGAEEVPCVYVANAGKELMAGRVDFKVDKAGVLHAPLGKVSFGPEKILGNLKALVETVNRLKPSAAKGTYMKNMAVSTTMGPGFKVDMALVKKFIEG